MVSEISLNQRPEEQSAFTSSVYHSVQRPHDRAISQYHVDTLDVSNYQFAPNSRLFMLDSLLVSCYFTTGQSIYLIIATMH